MGRRLRLWQPTNVYNITSRCADRRFLLKPNHLSHNNLLRFDSHPSSLDLENDILPQPSTINIIGASVGRALQQYPVPLHWLESNINHLHGGLSPKPTAPDNTSMFLQCTNSLIARFTNKQGENEGPCFGAPFHSEPILDDAAVEEKLFYSLTNPVKDNLVATVRESPFFSTFRHLAYGDPLRFWYIDWQAYWQAGGNQSKQHRAKDYLRWTEFELTPLPAWRDLSVHQRQTRVRQKVRELEQHYADVRRSENHSVIGVPALFRTDPRDRPRSPKEGSRQPICHTTQPALRREFRHRWQNFVHEHRKASFDYRNGFFEREFPEGSFRPPIKTIYTSSHL